MDEAKDETMSDGSAVAEETEMQVDSQEQTAAPDETSSSAGKVQANERLLFCAEVLIGYKCEVQVRGLRARGPTPICCWWMALQPSLGPFIRLNSGCPLVVHLL